MIIEDFLDSGNVHVGLRARDKRRLITDLSQRASQALGIDHGPVRDALLSREELGSTGMGEGIAIPHARLPAIERPFGVLATLKSPVAFASIDDQPVDLVCLLLLPIGSTGEHLGVLAAIARRLRDERIAAELRRARTAHDAFAAFVRATPSTEPP